MRLIRYISGAILLTTSAIGGYAIPAKAEDLKIRSPIIESGELEFENNFTIGRSKNTVHELEYGFTDFEHYGSIMPVWGSVAPGFVYDPLRDKQQPSNARVLSEQQIATLIQFIRHWESYSTLP